MDLYQITQHLLRDLKNTSALEFIAVIAGIASVWFSRKENILVYPVGLLNTIIFIFLSIKANLFGEASVNIYYTIVSIYGWILWSKKDKQHHTVVVIKRSTQKEWLYQLIFFIIFYVVLYISLTYLRNHLYPGAIPWADAFAASTAYTGMWLMARKKVESWYWWILTNLASVPLYYIKGYVFTSFQFIVLLVMAFAGLATWQKKAKHAIN